MCSSSRNFEPSFFTDKAQLIVTDKLTFRVLIKMLYMYCVENFSFKFMKNEYGVSTGLYTDFRSRIRFVL